MPFTRAALFELARVLKGLRLGLLPARSFQHEHPRPPASLRQSPRSACLGGQNSPAPPRSAQRPARAQRALEPQTTKPLGGFVWGKWAKRGALGWIESGWSTRGAPLSPATLNKHANKRRSSSKPLRCTTQPSSPSATRATGRGSAVADKPAYNQPGLTKPPVGLRGVQFKPSKRSTTRPTRCSCVSLRALRPEGAAALLFDSFEHSVDAGAACVETVGR